MNLEKSVTRNASKNPNALWLLLTALTGVTAFGCGGSTNSSTGGGTETRISLTVDRTTITPGEAVTLSWSSQNASSVKTTNLGVTDVNGSLVVSPKFTSDYTITVTGDTEKRATAHVTVTRPTPRFLVVGNLANPEVPEIQSALQGIGTVSVQSTIPTSSTTYDALILHVSGTFGPAEQATVQAALAANKGVLFVGFAPSKLATGASAFTTSGSATDDILDVSPIGGFFGGVTELIRSVPSTVVSYQTPVKLDFFALPLSADPSQSLYITDTGDNSRLPAVQAGEVSASGYRVLRDDEHALAFVNRMPTAGRIAWQWHVQGFDASLNQEVTALFKTEALFVASN